MEQIPNIEPSKNPDFEKMIDNLWKNNPEAFDLRNRALDFINSDSFDRGVLEKKLSYFNEKQEGEGQSGEIESISGKNGTLLVIYYPKNNKLRFVFNK